MNQNSFMCMKKGGTPQHRPNEHQRRKYITASYFDVAIFCLLVAIVSVAFGGGR